MNRRSEIIRSAAEVFAQRGIAGTSMEDIAGAVGISREAVYYHFRNRGEIMLEIIFPPTRALLRGIRQIIGSDVPAPEKLRAAIENHLDTFKPDFLAMAVALRESHYLGDRAKYVSISEMRNEYERCWVALVETGQKDGCFTRTVNPRLATYSILGMLNWTSRWHREDGEFTPAQIVDTFFAIISDGLSGGDTEHL